MWGSVRCLCIGGRLHHPWPPLIGCRNVPPVMTIKNASRLCQMSPGEQNCPRLRSTAVTDHVTLERSVAIPEPEPSSRKLALKSRRKLHTSLWFWPTEVLSAFAGLLPHAQHHAVDEGGTGRHLVPRLSSCWGNKTCIYQTTNKPWTAVCAWSPAPRPRAFPPGIPPDDAVPGSCGEETVSLLTFEVW